MCTSVKLNRTIEGIYGSVEKMKEHKNYKECELFRDRTKAIKEGFVKALADDRADIRWWDLYHYILFIIIKYCIIRGVTARLNGIISEYEEVMKCPIRYRMTMVHHKYFKFCLEYAKILKSIKVRYHGFEFIEG